MIKLTKWLYDRAHENSTYRGLIGAAGSVVALYYLFAGDFDKSAGAIAASQGLIAFIDTIRSEPKP